MALTISNQKISDLIPYYADTISKPYDADEMKACLSQVISPIWTPLQQAHPVEIEDDNNNKLSNDDIIDLLLETMGDKINANAEKQINSLWKGTLVNYGQGLPVNEVFSMQAAARAGISQKLYPSPTVIYTADDLKTACRNYIGMPNNQRDDSVLSANAAFFMTEPCVMFHCLCKGTFDDFKAYVANVVTALGTNLKPDVSAKFNDFANMNINIIEGLVMRKSDGDDCDEYSFSRTLMKCALEFSKISPDFGCIASHLDEFLSPKTIVFLDVDKISKTPTDRLTKALNDIKDGLKLQYKPISLNKINKLSSIASNKRRMAGQLAMHQQMMKFNPNGMKRAVFRFKKVAMTKCDLSKLITKIVKKEVNVSQSENYTKIIKSSFMRPNRRNPDNPNLAGKSISLQYKPDIHIYIDTSGSISEDNYKEAILTLITMAKKLDVNLYFNSFSHVISRQTKLQTKGKSVAGIYKEFQKVPKVTGGTEFSLVWDYIMRSPKRQKEISLMITDFEWSPPSKRVDYPKKLYYAPIATNKRYWNSMLHNVTDFCTSMYHIDRNIRKHILIN